MSKSGLIQAKLRNKGGSNHFRDIVNAVKVAFILHHKISLADIAREGIVRNKKQTSN